MSQVEQMLKDIEQRAQEKICIINGTVILEEDRPKYEAILRLQEFIDRNQSIFRELNLLAGAAGVETTSLVDSIALSEELQHEAPGLDGFEAPVVPENPAKKEATFSVPDAVGSFEPPVAPEIPEAPEMPQMLEAPVIPDTPAAPETPEAPAAPETPEAPALPDDGLSEFTNDVKIKLEDFVKTDHIDLTMKFPENKVDLYHNLNTWVLNNITVPNGYICYARVGADGNADIYLGSLDNFSWDKDECQKMYDAIKKDLTLYYDVSLMEDLTLFERKHGISRVEKTSLTLNLFKKKMYDTVPYTLPEKADTLENPQAGAPEPEAAAATVKPSGEVDNENLSLDTLMPISNVILDPTIPNNKYSIHDSLRKWLSQNILLPEGYVVYATVDDLNEATVYLGKLEEAKTVGCHELKTINVDLWESNNQVTRVDSKKISITLANEITKDAPNVPEAPAEPEGPEIPEVPDSAFAAFASEGASIPETPPKYTLHRDPADVGINEEEEEIEPTRVVGRRLTEWASSVSKMQTIKKGISFLNKLTGKSEMYVAFMDEIGSVDLTDEDALIKLADINNRLEREAMSMNSTEVNKIQKKLNKYVMVAQKNVGQSRKRG